MQLIVETINFNSGAIHLLVDGLIEPDDRDRLAEYIGSCRKINIGDIHIRFQDSVQAESRILLEQLAAATGANLEPSRLKDEDTISAKIIKFEFRTIGNPDRPGLNQVEYNLNLCKSEEALEIINPAMNLIGKSLNLDDQSLSRLQLCVYELLVNSVEHGNFTSENPVITLSISSNRTQVTVFYKDNADIFPTKRQPTMDIKQKIQTKSSRGLGLFIMNRLSQNFIYKRLGGWNITTFKIDKKNMESAQEPGRKNMSAFSIKLEQCDLENSIILQPIGAIDSSTTQNVEEHFKSLIRDHKQYIVVDFSRVTFISSSGIGILLGTVSTLREKGGDLIFMNVPTQLRDIFDILNITDYFVTVDSIKELNGAVLTR